MHFPAIYWKTQLRLTLVQLGFRCTCNCCASLIEGLRPSTHTHTTQRVAHVFESPWQYHDAYFLSKGWPVIKETDTQTPHTHTHMPWHSDHITDGEVASNETNLLNLPVEAWYSWNKTAFLGVLLSKIHKGEKQKNKTKMQHVKVQTNKTEMFKKYKKNVKSNTV